MSTSLRVKRGGDTVVAQFDANFLKVGDVIRMADGSPHYIQYVNNSGAYAVPLTSIAREIGGKEISFTAGGKMISITSMVEHINPLTLGGNSQEYRRYVRMASASGEGGAKVKQHGVTFDTFIDAAAEGHTAGSGAEAAPKRKGGLVAKKVVNGKAKSAEKREKAPKTVRKCVCACGSETTGHFAPGHDARYHGWIKKLADGRMEMKDIPASLRSKLITKETKEGVKVTNPDFYRNAEA